jgi:hypothetical protein
MKITNPYLISMSMLKFVEIGPGISQVGLDLHCTIKPLPGLGYFPLSPEYISKKSKNGFYPHFI